MAHVKFSAWEGDGQVPGTRRRWIALPAGRTGEQLGEFRGGGSCGECGLHKELGFLPRIYPSSQSREPQFNFALKKES